MHDLFIVDEGKTADDRKTRGTLDWKKRLQIAADAAKGSYRGQLL